MRKGTERPEKGYTPEQDNTFLIPPGQELIYRLKADKRVLAYVVEIVPPIMSNDPCENDASVVTYCIAGKNMQHTLPYSKFIASFERYIPINAENTPLPPGQTLAYCEKKHMKKVVHVIYINGGEVGYLDESVGTVNDICRLPYHVFMDKYEELIIPHKPSISDETINRAFTKRKEDNEEQVNHPKRYNQYPKEVIDMMVDIWGVSAVAQWCVMTAFKYRMRLGHKDDIQQELEKEQWYLNKAKKLNDSH